MIHSLKPQIQKNSKLWNFKESSSNQQLILLFMGQIDLLRLTDRMTRPWLIGPGLSVRGSGAAVHCTDMNNPSAFFQTSNRFPKVSERTSTQKRRLFCVSLSRGTSSINSSSTQAWTQTPDTSRNWEGNVKHKAPPPGCIITLWIIPAKLKSENPGFHLQKVKKSEMEKLSTHQPPTAATHGHFVFVPPPPDVCWWNVTPSGPTRVWRTAWWKKPWPFTTEGRHGASGHQEKHFIQKKYKTCSRSWFLFILINNQQRWRNS